MHFDVLPLHIKIDYNIFTISRRNRDGVPIMIKHERLILEKLTENPMLSQGELAAMLNLTRSSVSVYISHLMQMGFIRGRGYLIEDHNTIYVIGTASIDYRTTIDEALLRDPSHAATLDDNELNIDFGGIGKNISENMHRIGHNVSYIGAIGSDVLGQELLQDCRQNGIDVSDSLVIPAKKSSTYLEISSRDRKEIILSSANMKLQESLTPDFLQGKSAKLRHALAIVIEDSLSENSIQYISSNYSPIPIFMVCSKYTRVPRCMHFLNQFHALVTSLDIAWLILGERGIPPLQDVLTMDIARQLSNKVGGAVLMCYGKSEVVYAHDNQAILGRYSDPGYRAGIYAHYRDTVAAAFFHCLLEEADDEELLRYVCACRDIVSGTEQIVNKQLCPELVSSAMKKMSVEIHNDRTIC